MTRSQLPIVFLGSSTGMYNQIDICHALGRPIVGIYDQDYSSQETLHGLAILKELPSLECEYFVATFWTPFDGPVFERNRQKRQHLLDFMRDNNLKGATLIHPTAIVSPGAQVGRNVSIGALSYVSHGAVIQPNVLIREQVFIGHDVTIEENTVVQIKATITGNTDIGADNYIGINASIVNRMPLNRISIGENSLIYPNELVLTSVPKNNTKRSRRQRG
jgi:carbonic anhydrase/acetyltransferase-like protein (isoleucine patch superfamily)